MLPLGLLRACCAFGLVRAAVPATKPAQWALQASSDSPDGLHAIQARLIAAEIIPTVIDKFVPRYFLHADWRDHQHATVGNTLDPNKLKAQPAIKLYSNSPYDLDDDQTYVVTITDPDAPTHDDPKWSEFCHFIATNVPAPRPIPDIRIGQSHPPAAPHGDLVDVIPYKPPAPPPKTGKHRYVFLVFAPANGTTDALHLTKPSDRKHWGHKHSGHGVREWASENGLVPVAANFIYAQNKEQ